MTETSSTQHCIWELQEVSFVSKILLSVPLILGFERHRSDTAVPVSDGSNGSGIEGKPWESNNPTSW